MRLNTYLNAMEKVRVGSGWDMDRRIRQYHAFRAGLLRRASAYRNFAEANGFDEKQAWFWTDEWQAGEKEVDCHTAKGEIHSFDSMDKFLETLEVDND